MIDAFQFLKSTRYKKFLVVTTSVQKKLLQFFFFRPSIHHPSMIEDKSFLRFSLYAQNNATAAFNFQL